MEHLNRIFSQLHRHQLQIVILYLQDTRKNYLYVDLPSAVTDVHSVEHLDTADIERRTFICNQIQYILERRVINVMEQIAHYIKAFVPKPRDSSVESLQDAIFLKLVMSLKDPFVVKDLYPTQADAADIRLKTSKHEPTHSEQDNLFQEKLLDFVAKKTKTVVIDTLSKKYGISSSIINEFMNECFFGYEKKVRQNMETAGLPMWPRHESDAVKTCKIFSYRCANNLSTLIQETEDYVKNKYNQMVLVKRLQFELFGLLEQTKLPLDIFIPSIPKLPLELQHALLQLPEVYGCGTLWGELTLLVTQRLQTFRKNEVKKLLLENHYRHNFSSQVVLPCTELANKCFGEKKAEQENKIEGGNSIRAKKLGGTKDNIAHPCANDPIAHDIETEDNQHKYGTLGCFVKLKKPTTEDEGVLQRQPKEMYAITCDHCLQGCQDEVEVKFEEQYRKLGRKIHSIYEPHAFDVATVKVDIDIVNNSLYSSDLRDAGGDVSIWTVYIHDPVKKHVFKHGSATQCTNGVCIAVDFMTKQMMEDWNEKLKTKGQANLDPDYSILIACEPDNTDQTQIAGLGQPERRSGEQNLPEENQNDEIRRDQPPRARAPSEAFSADGDSGSVVCCNDVNSSDICAISLLHGALYEADDKGKPVKFLCSISSSLKNTMQRLVTECNV